ncbi:PA0061/PA0062 family lipoprotein [Pseudomonas sp. 22526]|uniref:PA0061/PA0062 family lipoprotein n=1 Tax=Pseudomonas sp. 22526 TaxID=3453937 RepID=UPI003F84BEAC
MNAKPLLLIPALSLVLLLSACAGPMPQPDPKEAWISLEEEGPSDLMAERVDGKNVDDGRYFEVQPGAHRLDVTLFEEVGGDSNQVDCRGHVSYPNFQAGEHYKLVESTLGTEVRARLLDAQGKQVARVRDFECMPG